jgi:hypothetical protein
MKEEHKQIVTECLEAVDCARKGLPHPRLNSMMDRTIDEMERRAAPRQIVKGGIKGTGNIRSRLRPTVATIRPCRLARRRPISRAGVRFR